MPHPPPTSTLFPYTTLFRSHADPRHHEGEQQQQRYSGQELRDAGMNPPAHSQSGREKHHEVAEDRKSTRLNSSHSQISYAVFCLKKKKYMLMPLTLCRQSNT